VFGHSRHYKTARLIGVDVGTGVARHLRLLEEMLASAGFSWSLTPRHANRRGDRAYAVAASHGLRWPTVDLQLFTQDLNPRLLPFAKRNVLLPMQEWFDPRSIPLLRGVDTILCQSEHSAEIFRPIHHDVRTMGFTSVDRFEAVAPASRTRILHVAGRSPYKGSAQLVRIWQRHPEWPTLTLTHAEGIVQPLETPNIEQHIGHLPDEQIRRYQNEAWLHVQTSEAEGFGHCLFEAMSCGAVVVAVDAPPMNELFSVTDSEGFVVPTSQQIPLNMGYRFIADDAPLERELERVLALGPALVHSVGDAARRRFESQDRRVRDSYAAFFVEPARTRRTGPGE